jgi:hypothetical protein
MAAALYASVPFTIPAAFEAELKQAAGVLDAGVAALNTAQSVLTAVAGAGIDSDHKAVAYFIFGKALKTANAVQVLSM